MGSISVISKVPSLELDDEYSSSTERFATLTNSVSIGMGPTTEIEGGCEVLEGDEVGEDHKGIFMRTQVTMRVHNNKAPIDDGDMA